MPIYKLKDQQKITAKQWFPPGDERHQPIAEVIEADEEFIQRLRLVSTSQENLQGRVFYVVHQKSGLFILEPSDYVILTSLGQFTIKQEVFEKFYELL
jgi:hypothetical protein